MGTGSGNGRASAQAETSGTKRRVTERTIRRVVAQAETQEGKRRGAAGSRGKTGSNEPLHVTVARWRPCLHPKGAVWAAARDGRRSAPWGDRFW
jgi:hypothetical protein